MATHQNNRAEIELRVGSVELGRLMLDRLGTLHGLRIAPLLDRVCSELSGPDRIDRIDLIELDLGSIEFHGFEAEFVTRLEAGLRSELGKALRNCEAGEVSLQGHVELVECFALTGNLPWWADPAAPDLVGWHLRELVRRAPAQWAGLLRRLAAEPVALGRLVSLCDDDLLVALIGLSAGADVAAVVSELFRMLEAMPEWRASSALRERTRTRVLGALGERDQISAEELVDVVLRELPVQTLVQPVPPHRPRPSDHPPAAIRRKTTRAEQEFGASPLPAFPDRGIDSGIDIGDEPADGRPLSVVSHAAIDRGLRMPGDQPPAQTHTSRSDMEPLADGARKAQAPPVVRDAEPAASLRGPETTRTALAADNARSRLPDAHSRALARLEEIHVDSAGLVILWPFVERLFARVGLLDVERRFLDQQARMLAVALLAQIAFEEVEPPEYRLPLAKLLCGLSPTAPYELARPPTPEQCDECRRLLAAVIAHAPILRDLSIEDFRRTFVKRSGILSVRAGTWLLQAQRQTHDVLLDRFSWSWAWLKLPWMPDALQVEW